jgi:hypothetical protein
MNKGGAILIVLFSFASLTVSAQITYFDIGCGVGTVSTEIDLELKDEYRPYFEDRNNGVFDNIPPYAVGRDHGLAVDWGLKAGYGPFGNIHLYFVNEYSGFIHRLNSGLISGIIVGPGVIIYPIPYIQLGSSLGFLGYTIGVDGVGFAWNVSAAVDLGKGNLGFLIGIKYSYAYTSLDFKVYEQISTVGIFVKFAYREKASSSAGKSGKEAPSSATESGEYKEIEGAEHE